MPRKKGETSRYQAAEIQGQLSLLANSVRDGDAADWSAVDGLELGELLGAMCATDAGVMLRSSEQGQAIAIGVFLGGGKQWVTCRDAREVLAVLRDFLGLLEARVGSAPAPVPTPKGRGAAKGS